MGTTKSVLKAKEATLEGKVQECDQLNYDLYSACDAVSRGKKVIRNFSD